MGDEKRSFSNLSINIWSFDQKLAQVILFNVWWIVTLNINVVFVVHLNIMRIWTIILKTFIWVSNILGKSIYCPQVPVVWSDGCLWELKEYAKLGACQFQQSVTSHSTGCGYLSTTTFKIRIKLALSVVCLFLCLRILMASKAFLLARDSSRWRLVYEWWLSLDYRHFCTLLSWTTYLHQNSLNYHFR